MSRLDTSCITSIVFRVNPGRTTECHPTRATVRKYERVDKFGAKGMYCSVRGGVTRAGHLVGTVRALSASNLILGRSPGEWERHISLTYTTCTVGKILCDHVPRNSYGNFSTDQRDNRYRPFTESSYLASTSSHSRTANRRHHRVLALTKDLIW